MMDGGHPVLAPSAAGWALDPVILSWNSGLTFYSSLLNDV